MMEQKEQEKVVHKSSFGYLMVILRLFPRDFQILDYCMNLSPKQEAIMRNITKPDKILSISQLPRIGKKELLYFYFSIFSQ